MRRARRTQAGLTLIELMIAMLLSSIAVAAAFAVGSTLSNSYTGHQRGMVIERGARASLQFISRRVRAASPGVPTGDIEDLVGCTTPNAPIRVVNGGTNAPDELFIISGAGAVTGLRTDFTTSSTTIEVFDGSEFRAGDYVVITDRSQGHLLEVDGVSSNDLTTAAPSGLCGGATFPTGDQYVATSLVIRAKMGRLFVRKTAAASGREVDEVPLLMLDPNGDGVETDAEPIADGVEDLQIAVAVDVDGDGTITEIGTVANDDEWFYNVAGDSDPPDFTTTPWRALRITVTARSFADTEAPDSIRPAIEDRTASASGPFRRRTLSTIIEIRNAQGSPN